MQAFRQCRFNVFYENKDDYGKNFAFLYDEDLGGYVLSLAYDLTRVTDKFEHEMTVNGNGNPMNDDLLAVAKEFRLSITKCKSIMTAIEKNLRVNYIIIKLICINPRSLNLVTFLVF